MIHSSEATSPLLEQLHSLGEAAISAAHALAIATTGQKNDALLKMATELLDDEQSILEANHSDLQQAKEKNISAAMLDRLMLNTDRLHKMVKSIRTTATLPDPVGRVLKSWKHPNGMLFEKVSVPLGVLGIIYESRPNVTSDAATLCLKAGNATILRGGSEAFHSNQAIAKSLQKGLQKAGLPEASIQFVPSVDRHAIALLCEMDRYIHCMIPRGGKGLIETVKRHARMPVIKHDDGICIAYVDASADLEKAKNIILNGKCQRPGVCNALETLLVHPHIALALLQTTGEALLRAGVELRCDEKVLHLFPTELKKEFANQLKKAQPEDFKTEFLSLILAIKIVSSLEEAIEHIQTQGSHHSDLIITEQEEHAERFLREVDSSTVYWNASTRFTDGGEFGFGAEIGISTGKLHARGPMGLEELTSYKYLIRGHGEVRRS